MCGSQYERTKNFISKELEGESFYLPLRMIEKNKWKKWHEKISSHAVSLIKEINRSKNVFEKVSVESVMNEFQNNGNKFYFDYFGECGTVRIVFKKDKDDYIQFDHIEEKIFEEVLALI